MGNDPSLASSIPQCGKGAKPLRFLAVTRLSTSGQKGGYGRERQEEWEIGEYVVELGATVVENVGIVEKATVFNRPLMEEVLAKGIDLHHRGEIDGMMFASVERLGRDPYNGGAICETVLKAGLPLYFAAERLCAANEGDQDRIVSALMAARAYVRRLRAQTVPARRARAKDGKLPNGHCRWPFDYDPATGRATPNPDRARHVRAWAEILLRGSNLADVIRYSEGQGVPAPKGGKWNRSTISRILADSALKGEFQHRYIEVRSRAFYEAPERVNRVPELVYVDKGNAILSDAEWSMVGERLRENKERSVRNTKRNYGPLHRRVFCGDCGRALYVNPQRGWAAFRCRSCDWQIGVGRLWKTVKEGLIAYFGDVARNERIAKGVLDTGRSATLLKQEIEERKEALAECAKQENRVLRMGVALEGYGDKLAGILHEIRQREAALLSEIASRESDLAVLAEKGITTKQFRAIALRLSNLVGVWRDHHWRWWLAFVGFNLFTVKGEGLRCYFDRLSMNNDYAEWVEGQKAEESFASPPSPRWEEKRGSPSRRPLRAPVEVRL